jgi:hypothetical protein
LNRCNLENLRILVYGWRRGLPSPANHPKGPGCSVPGASPRTLPEKALAPSVYGRSSAGAHTTSDCAGRTRSVGLCEPAPSANIWFNPHRPPLPQDEPAVIVATERALTNTAVSSRHRVPCTGQAHAGLYGAGRCRIPVSVMIGRGNPDVALGARGVHGHHIMRARIVR